MAAPAEGEELLSEGRRLPVRLLDLLDLVAEWTLLGEARRRDSGAARRVKRAPWSTVKSEARAAPESNSLREFSRDSIAYILCLLPDSAAAAIDTTDAI